MLAVQSLSRKLVFLDPINELSNLRWQILEQFYSLKIVKVSLIFIPRTSWLCRCRLSEWTDIRMNNFQNVFNLIYRLSFIKPHSLSPVWRHLRLSAWTIEIVVNFTTISMAWTRWRSRFVHVIIQPIRRLETKESTRSFSAENEFNDFRRKIINISKRRPDTRQNGIQHNV